MSAEPRTITNENIAAFRDMVHGLARGLDGLQGAEYDDLFQEGQIAVWSALLEGKEISKEIIRRKMLNWVNICARHGLSGYEQ